MRISDWSSDVCSSDLQTPPGHGRDHGQADGAHGRQPDRPTDPARPARRHLRWPPLTASRFTSAAHHSRSLRSEEPTSELQSLMRISYAVFCLKKKKE